MKKIAYFIISLFVLASCSKDKGGEDVPAVKFSVDTTNITLDIGQTIQIKTQGGIATAITPTAEVVAFSIDKNTISVKAIKAGEQTFTLHSGDQTAQIKVVVKSAPVQALNGLGVYQAGANLISANRINTKDTFVWLSQGNNPYDKFIMLHFVASGKKVGDEVEIPIKSNGISILSGKEKLVGTIELISVKTAQLKTADNLQVVVPIKQ